MSTGTLGFDGGSGRPNGIYPIVTKGMGEGETPANINMNYFLGITATGVIGADFEDKAGGINHPAWGSTAITTGIWHHIAATYTGTCWALYLDGNLETLNPLVTACPNATPESASIQHAALAAGLNSSGGLGAGFFSGVIDEARLWNVARSQAEIQATMLQGITSGTGLIARWGLNQGSGTSATDSVSGVVNGTLTNGPTWVTGTPFELTFSRTFQEGVNGYIGTVDTHIKQVSPNLSFGSLQAIKWDTRGTDTDPSTQEFGLIRFDNIFGSGTGQIPAGASIVSATLQYTVFNASASPNANVNEILSDWTEETTWDAFGNTPGVQPEDYGVLVTTAPASATGNYTIDVTSSLAAWSTNPLTTNRGWIFRPNDLDGVDIRSSEYTTSSNRPLLRVNYTPPPSTPPAAPSGLSATAPTHTQVHLTWNDNANNESNFQLERSTNGISGGYSLRATLAANTSVYDDLPLSPLNEYCYRVRAVNIAGQSGYADPVCVTTPAAGNTAIRFGANNAYVTLGDPDALKLPQFTIETWFKREGAGVTITTGSDGISNAVPLVSKGTSQADGTNVDMNFFLGIDNDLNVIAADFEEGAGGGSPGRNNPIRGATILNLNTWYHAAATYDGTKWQLFLNGNMEAEISVNQPPRSDSIQHASLGSSIRSDGTTAQGFFNGVLDEARIWNYARTQAQIQADLNSEISTNPSGLVARWGMNEGSDQP